MGTKRDKLRARNIRRVLSAIDNPWEYVTRTVLARRLGIEPKSATSLLRRLELRGYVESGGVLEINNGGKNPRWWRLTKKGEQERGREG